MQVWDPANKAWVKVGWVVDGANRRVLYAVLRGLLLEWPGGQVHCEEPVAKRNERYALDGDGTLRELQPKAVT